LASSFKGGIGATSLTSGFVFAVRSSLPEKRSNQEQQSESPTQNITSSSKNHKLRSSQQSTQQFTLFTKKKKN
jgi:hypothetical protein